MILSVILIGTSMPTMAAKKVNNQKNDEKVTLIVRLKDGAVLEKDDIANGGKEYLRTKKGLKESRKILRTQSSVQSTIKNDINEYIKLKYSYTAVINGFAIEAKKSDIEKIKRLPSVKAVSVAKKLKLYSENRGSASNEMSISDDCCNMLGIDALKKEGYLGQGMTVAVIDNELDVEHGNFSGQPENPKYSKNDVKNMVNNMGLNASSTVNSVYHSSKIPFAYDYSTKTGNTNNDEECHGTHVSGIVVGSGTTPDGKKTIGVAPQAQLFFFGISDMSNAAAIAAMDDIAKMGIDVVNCSWGMDYAALENDLEEAIENLTDAGTYVSFAAGNTARGIAGNTPEVEMIDYSTSGSPANSSRVSAVASADNITYWNGGKENYSDGKTVSDFSSYAAGDDLSLKPDITATGGGVYSSVSNGKYAVYSGTSMASPHVAGAVLLLSQYLGDKFGKDAIQKNQIMESLLMSSAEILYRNKTDKIPYAARLQGAGLLNLKAATELSSYFTGDNGKAKLSLGDGISEKFTLKFRINNITDHDVTYQSTNLNIVTDGYDEDENTGKVYVADEVPLEIKDSTLPKTITVKAGESKEVSVDVLLDKTWLEKNSEVFINGFYIDGFIELTNANDSSSDISMPFMGFYGDWESEQIFDSTYYSGESKLPETFLGSFYDQCTGDYNEEGIFVDNCQKLGVNYYTEDDTYDKEEYVAISPNGDDMQDNLCINVTPIRNCKDVVYTIKNEKGEVVEPDADYFEKYEEEVESNAILSKFTAGCMDLYNDYFTNCPDGKYYAEISAKLDYFGAKKTQTIVMPFIIDKSAPRVSGLKYSTSAGKDYLEMTLEDNNNLMGFNVYENDDTDYSNISEPLEGLSKKNIKVDVSGMKRNRLEVLVMDYAGNKTVIKVEKEMNRPTNKPTTGTTMETPTPTKGTPEIKTTVANDVQAKATALGKTKITTIKSKKKSLLIKWKKISGEISGYEIQYSTSKKFAKKNTKKITIRSPKKNSKAIKNLKSKKKYYVRIRTYRKAAGKMLYSKWSNKVSKKTK